MGTLPMKVSLSKIGYDYLDLVLESKRNPENKTMLTNILEKDGTSEPLCNKYFIKNPDDQAKLLEKRLLLQKKFNTKYYRKRPELMKKQSDKIKKDQETFLKQALGRTMKTRSQSRESQPKINRITLKRKRVIYSPSKSKSKSNSKSKSKSKSQSRSRTQSKRPKVQQVRKKPRTRSDSKHSSTLRNYMKPLKHIKKWVKNTKGRKMAYLL
jgi:small subunit ribosomal protein S1